MYKKFFLNKDFMKLTAANMINAFGDSVDGVAFTWLTYEISQSAALSAVVAALNILPTALFQPIAGPIAERCREKAANDTSGCAARVHGRGRAGVVFDGRIKAMDAAFDDVFDEYCGSNADSVRNGIDTAAFGKRGV